MKKRRSRKFCLLMIGVIVLTFTLTCTGYFTYIIIPFRHKIDLQIEGDRILANDDIIGFTAAKGASSLRKHPRTGLAYHLFTDPRGARVNSPRQITPDKVTMMTIGCSFSLGHGIENEETFTAILGQRFDVPVANFAMASYGTLQSLQMLERNLDLAPNVIIYGFVEDHIRRSLSPCAPSFAPLCLAVSYVAIDSEGKPYIHPPRTKYSAAMNQQFIEDVVWDRFGLNDIIWGARIAWFRLASKKMLTYSNDEESRRECTNFLMNKMIEFARKINATLIVIHIPYFEKGSTNSAPSELINSLSQDTVFIDLSSAVKDYYQNPENPDLRLHKYDGHPNASAHKLMADEIEKVIKNRNIFLK